MSVVAELTGVRKSYGATVALAEIDLRLDRGVIGLLGPNGAGKTTLMRLLATAIEPSAGRIRVCGHDATGSLGERTEARRHLGYLPQEVSYPRGMTAFAFLDYLAVLKEWGDRGERHREVVRVLDLVGLGDRRTSRVSSLSGGQRRRLALAQALIGDPDLVILDEPTTGVDPEQRASLRALLSGRADQGCVLFSTHQTDDVAALCDRVIVLDQGRVRFDGTVAELVAVARGRVWVGAEATSGAVAAWRIGTGEIHSVGGRPTVSSRPADPAVEDAYLLLRAPEPADPTDTTDTLEVPT